MKVVIEGSRSSREDWLRAQKLSSDELPILSPAQKQVAAELRISEETYARSAKAGELSSGELAAKARTLGEWVERESREWSPGAQVLEVRLVTFEGLFQILLHVADRTLALRIEEDLVDRLLETGSGQAEARLRRILDMHMPRPIAS